MPRGEASKITRINQTGRECAIINFPVIEDCPAERVDLLRDIIEGLPMGVFVVGPDGRLVASNLAGDPGGVLRTKFEAVTLGSPFEYILHNLPLHEADFDRAYKQISKVVVGTTTLADETYQLVAADPYNLTVRAIRLPDPGNLSLVALAVARTSGRDRVSQRQRQIQILRAQDEERRRIARDLHDNTAQQLALIQVKLETLRSARSAADIDFACMDIEAVLQSAHHQMRTLSYVLHPPELVSGGVVEALGSFLRGFARRTGLTVKFDNTIGRLKVQAAHEIALYRVTQEALINVNKHAFATAVRVGLAVKGSNLVLEVEDNGIGISYDIVEGRKPEALGVGLTGMRERVEALGGTFHAERGAAGTLISAHFPQRRSSDGIAASRLDDVVPDGI